MSFKQVLFNAKEIIICWTPSHIGVRGNERADSAAKSALDLPPDESRIPYTDLKPTINKFFHTKWQQLWSNNIHNKLFQIQPTLGEWRPASRKSRREQVVIFVTIKVFSHSPERKVDHQMLLRATTKRRIFRDVGLPLCWGYKQLILNPIGRAVFFSDMCFWNKEYIEYVETYHNEFLDSILE